MILGLSGGIMHKVFGALSLAFLFTAQLAFAECRPGQPCFRGGGRVIMGGGCRPGMPCFNGGGGQVIMGGGCRPGMSCFNGGNGGGFVSPFNGGVVNNDPSSFIPGTNPADPRFVSNGDPARVLTIVESGTNRRIRGEVRDSSNNVIATTNQFDQFGRPFFDTASTGLSSDGFRRVAAAPQSTNPGQIPAGTRLPDASLQEEALQGGGKRWVQTRPGFQNQPIEVVTGIGAVFQQNGNTLTQVQGAPGDLVTRDGQGRLVLVDKTVGQELMKKYQTLPAEQRARIEAQRPGSGVLIDSVVARQTQVAGTGNGGGNPPPANGTHTNPGSNTPVRPVDNSAAPSKWTAYKDVFEKAAVPTSETVGEFVKVWGDPETIVGGRPTAPIKMQCVSNADKNKENPMTLFVSRTKNPTKPDEWLTNVRLDEGQVEITKAEIDKNRDRESLLLPDEAKKSWSASRSFFPTKVNYDLRTVQVDGKLKFWMKVTATLDTGKLEYLCGKTEAARKEPNPGGTPTPPKPGEPPPKDEKKPAEPPPADNGFKDDAEIAGRTQLSTKNAQAKLPELLGKCAVCHAPGQKKAAEMSVGPNGVTVRSSEAPDKKSAAELILGRVDDMVDSHSAKMGLTNEAEKTKLKSELEVWARTAGGVSR